MQMGELAEHFAVFNAQASGETGIAQPGLPLRLTQIAKLVQALHDGLPAWRRQLLPARKQRLLHFVPLIGSHLLPDLLALSEFLLLCRVQFIPGLETLADSRLLIRRQIPETLIVLEESFLAVRRHILEALKHLGRQVVPGVDTRTHGVRAIRPWELRAAWRRLRLADFVELLPEGGRTEQAGRQENGHHGPGLETLFHSLVSFVTSFAAGALGRVGSSVRASNLESTS